MTDQSSSPDIDRALIGLAERLDRLCLTSTEDGRRFVLATESAGNIVEIVREWLRTRLPVQAATPSTYAQISELDDASNACLELAAKHGLATGHGDTVADMIREFSGQIRTPDPAQPSWQDKLRLLADLFTEAEHETWRKEEIVSIIEDAIRLGSPISSTQCATCNGRGTIGGFVNATSGYQDDPCPDCGRDDLCGKFECRDPKQKRDLDAERSAAALEYRRMRRAGFWQ